MIRFERASALASLVFIVMVAACGGPDEVVNENRADIEASLDALGRIGTDVAGRSAATDTALEAPADADFSHSGTGIIVSVNQLANPCDGPEGRWENIPQSSNNFVPPWSGTSDSVLRPTACFVRNGQFLTDYEESFVRNAVTRLAAAKYVLVVRIARAVAPRLSTEEIATGELETFEMGAIVGDVLLYELSSARFIDGAAFQVTNDAEVEVTNVDTRSQLSSNLVELLGRAVDDLVR